MTPKAVAKGKRKKREDNLQPNGYVRKRRNQSHLSAAFVKVMDPYIVDSLVGPYNHPGFIENLYSTLLWKSGPFNHIV